MLQYMDLLVSHGRGRSSSVDALVLPICFMPQVPVSDPWRDTERDTDRDRDRDSDTESDREGVLSPHQGTLALSTLHALHTRGRGRDRDTDTDTDTDRGRGRGGLPIQVAVEEFKRSKLFAVRQKLTNALLRCVKVSCGWYGLSSALLCSDRLSLSISFCPSLSISLALCLERVRGSGSLALPAARGG